MNNDELIPAQPEAEPAPRKIVHQAEPYVAPEALTAPVAEVLPNDLDDGGIDTVDLGVPEVDPEAAAAADAAAAQAAEPPQDDEEAEEEFSFPAPTPNNNATLEVAYSKPIDDNLWDDLATIIALPADTAARTLNYSRVQPNDELASGEQGQAWAETVGGGLGHGSFHDNMLPAAQREGAEWQQRIIYSDPKKPLTIGAPRIHDDDGPLLTGKRGLLRINAELGRGSIMQVPLWHSGIWITLQRPEETELLDTFDQIMNNKIGFGRLSNGLAFANHAVIDNGAVMDLAMRCLFETTAADVGSAAELRALIQTPDIHLIAWGLACVMHPRGFQFERSILDPKGVRNTVLKENLNVGACLWVDRSSLNDWQIKHMAKRATGSMSRSEIKTYTEHFVRGAEKPMALNDKLGLTLRVPTIDQYLLAGQQWVDELTAAVNEAFTQDLSEKQRREMILDRARATSMRQYAHWVKSIDVPSLAKRMENPDDVSATLANLSSDNAIRDKYYELMRGYINDSQIAMVAVPQVHPDEAHEVRPRFENLIPLDPISVFFSLLSQKIQQIRMRP